ncbi:hypothetical protein [Shimia sediminis]|nr:hypothetical protein [Shimia sediminis]
MSTSCGSRALERLGGSGKTGVPSGGVGKGHDQGVFRDAHFARLGAEG